MVLQFKLGCVFAPLLFAALGQSSRFKIYTIPGDLVGPCDLVDGPDGALWGQGIVSDVFFRLNTTTGTFEQYTIPFTTPINPNPPNIPGVAQTILDKTALACAIRNGADGNIYAGNGLRNQLARINPTTKKISIFDTPSTVTGDVFNFNDLYSAKDGIWFTSTTANAFNFFSFKTEKVTQHDVPTPVAIPLGVYVDPSSGYVYISELVGNKILVYQPKSGKTTEYPLPAALQGPAVIRSQVGDDIFFSMFEGNGIGRFNTKTHAISLYHTNQTGLLGSEDTVDDNGGTWLSSFTTNVMSRLDAKTLEWSYVALPKTFASKGANGVIGDIPPYVDIAVNYGPGNKIWFTSLLKNAVGSYNLDGLYD